MKVTVSYHILIIAIALIISSCAHAPSKSSLVPFYIGTYTHQSSEGIYYAYFDTITGQLSEVSLAAKINNPSYFAICHQKSLLISVSEGNGASANLYSYNINSKTGSLIVVDSLKTTGLSSCYVSIIGNVAAFANYSSGDVTFVHFADNGKFLEAFETFQHHGQGPNESRQQRPHAHSIVADINNEYLYAADLGIDKVMVYKITGTNVTQVGEIEITAGGGPRHISFHPSGKLMAVLNELNHSIEIFKVNEVDGIFTEKTQVYSMLPESDWDDNASADIHFSQDGKHLYASIRGVNHIERFSVDLPSASVNWIGYVTHGINWPRNFTLDPSGNFLLVANQNTDDIVVYKRNKNSGLLELTANKAHVSMPVCLKF
jgi:6-phosphogluconolactonase